MSFFIKNGVKIYFEDYGKGFPIVLTYGLAGSTDMWKNQISQLSSNHRLILWDQRGQGKSDWSVDENYYDIYNSVEDLYSLLEHLNIKEAIIGGQSLGGGVSIRFALQYPKLVKGLILCNSHSASGLNSSIQLKNMRNTSIKMIENFNYKEAIQYIIINDPNIKSRFEVFPAQSERIKAELLEMFSKVNMKAYMNTIKAMRKQDDISKKVKDLKMPILLISGDKDPSLNSMKYLSTVLSNCSFKIIKNAGHHANMDNSLAFNNTVLLFLNKYNI